MRITRRLSGVAAVAGGALWIVFATLAAGRPEGCVGNACLLQSHRDLGELELLFLAGGLLLLLGFAGLAGRLRLAPAAVATGVALIFAGATSEDLWTPLVVPGILACVAGFALVGIAAVRERSLPRWVGVLLAAGALGLLAANDQDARVLMLIPFALAWIAAGAVLVRGRAVAV